MINVKDIMKGNWLNTPDGPRRLDYIQNAGLWVNEKDTRVTWHNFEYIHTIPITKESILLVDPEGDNICASEPGRIHFGVFLDNGDDSVSVTIFDDGLVFTCIVLESSHVPLPHIQYIHQLQNLYHALTGKELCTS